MLRRPTLDTLIRHYIDKRLDFSGGTLIDFAAGLNRNGRSVKVKGLEALKIAGRLAPFLFAPTDAVRDEHGFAGEIIGKRRRTSDNKDFIQFHYDLSNDFYALFLDPEMVYSCAYFTDWDNDIATAQAGKLEMICRKLRLKPGDRLLDIGSGWGGLVCHAAKAYGVKAHGITLSEEQLAFAREKVKRLGLEGQVTFELTDYSQVGGRYDKIASIGMYEHIGLKNIPAYMSKVRSLLTDDGLFLNHAIARRAPKPSPFGRRLRPEQKAIAKYIFPGGELDDIGRSSPWSGRASRCRTWKPGACTTRARAGCGASGSPSVATRRSPIGRRSTGSGSSTSRVSASPSRAARCACSRRSCPRAPNAHPRCRRRAPTSIGSRSWSVAIGNHGRGSNRTSP